MHLGISLGLTGGGQGNRAGIDFARSVAIIGDSRTQDGIQLWKNAASADWKGLPTASGFCGPAITADASGTLEFRAADDHLRWTAPSDTAGPWTPAVAGWLTLESATAGKYLYLGLKSLTGLPGTDQTVTVSCSGTMHYALKSYGYWNRALNVLKWLQPSPAVAGVGGSTTADVIEQLDHIESVAAGAGWDIILLSTNDISASTAAATITANLQTIYDARRSLGRRLVIVGEHARWGVNSSTPMTAGQIAIFDAVVAFQEQYALDNGCVFIDAYALTYDSGQTDRRPASGMLRDQVHLTERGAQIIGDAIADALVLLMGKRRSATSADSNQFAAGYIAGSGGTVGTGITGAVASGWSASRASGADAAATASVEARADGVSGNWQRLQCTASAAGIIQFEGLSASTTLSALGLAVGDQIYFECEYDVRSATNLKNLEFFVLFDGTSPLTSLRANLDTGSAPVMADEAGIARFGPVAIPTGSTRARPYVYVELLANGAADVRIANFRIVKMA